MEEGFYFTGVGGNRIYTYCWNNVDNPKAIVQIFHGMAEHAARYGRFAEFLNQNGFIVYADDHRGHGKTAGTSENLGFIGEDGFNAIVQDECILTDIIKKNYPELPVIVLGHSFGSFLAQEYITRYGNKITGTILTGSACNNRLLVIFGKIITTIQRSFLNERKKAYLVNKIAFGKFNSIIENPASYNSWLSRDEAEVKKYDEDPYCGFVLTINFFYNFFDGLSKLYKSVKLRNLPDKLPVLILSGDSDPVGNYGKYVLKLYNLYTEKGMEKVQIKLYPGGRHEIINEINREEVFNDILVWINHVSKEKDI